MNKLNNNKVKSLSLVYIVEKHLGGVTFFLSFFLFFLRLFERKRVHRHAWKWREREKEKENLKQTPH